MFTYSGPKRSGWRCSASENCLPDSTSVFSWRSTALNRACSVCSAMPSSAARSEMPARTITASCVVKSSTCLVVGLPELSCLSFASAEAPASCFARTDRTFSPLARSTSDAAPESAALIVPVTGDPSLETAS